MSERTFSVARARARAAYERGRLIAALARAAIVTAVLAGVAIATVGPLALRFLPAAFVAWTLADWRGRALVRGARLGVIAGLVALVMPMAVLRSCCAVGMNGDGDCCSSFFGMCPACSLSGAVVGLVLAAFLPRGRDARRVETALGMIVGMVPIAALKCTALIGGEAVGLIAGLLTGVVVASGAMAVVDRRAATAS